MAIHFYTPEEVAFLRANIQHNDLNKLTSLFNAQFGLTLCVNQIRAACKNRGLKSGINAKFSPGHVPANKGVKGVGGWAPTQFTKGHRPHNRQPIGTERVNGEGYVDIKIAEPNQWRAKHIIEWEQKNGLSPKGFAIIFADGNRRNFAIDNLVKVSRQELLYLNRNGLIYNNADLTKVGINVAKVAIKTFQKICTTNRPS